MKRIAVIILIVIGVVAVAALFTFKLKLNGYVKSQIEETGKLFARVPVSVGSVDVSPFTGSVVIYDLLIANPEGYGDATAIKLSKIEISLSPFSVLSDKITLHSMKVVSPLVNVQGSMRDNNITRLEANVRRGTNSGTEKHRFRVDDFTTDGGTVRVETPVGDPVGVSFPVIHFQDLGKDEKGITMGELFSKVFFAVSSTSQQIASDVFSGAMKGVGRDIGEGFDKAVQDVKDLFK